MLRNAYGELRPARWLYEATYRLDRRGHKQLGLKSRRALSRVCRLIPF